MIESEPAKVKIIQKIPKSNVELFSRLVTDGSVFCDFVPVGGEAFEVARMAGKDADAIFDGLEWGSDFIRRKGTGQLAEKKHYNLSVMSVFISFGKRLITFLRSSAICMYCW